MHPPVKTTFVSAVLFFEIYFLVIITGDVKSFSVGRSEVCGALTVGIFLLSLRIADDFKDYKTDKILFPTRPLPSGRVHKSDLMTLLVTANVVSIVLNLLFMNNFWFYLLLMGYGTLMSVWFFARTKIQKNLPLALITHNPIQLVINAYIISFTCMKYYLPLLSFNTVLIAFTLYWPGLIWEISRKVRAPKDETEYTTYSKLFGYQKCTKFVIAVLFLDVLTSGTLMYRLWPWGIIAVALAFVWLVFSALKFMKNPEKHTLVSRVEIYELITELPVILIEIIYLLGGFVV
jgi:4-hydroxybenzoate polyprenyltransferase